VVFDVSAVTSRIDLADFLDALAREVASDRDEEVENPTTDRFLEALGAWVRHPGRDAAGRPLMSDPPGWSDIAQILFAGVFYE
jgi:hypothetical protein